MRFLATRLWLPINYLFHQKWNKTPERCCNLALHAQLLILNNHTNRQCNSHFTDEEAKSIKFRSFSGLHSLWLVASGIQHSSLSGSFRQVSQPSGWELVWPQKALASIWTELGKHHTIDLKSTWILAFLQPFKSAARIPHSSPPSLLSLPKA